MALASTDPLVKRYGAISPAGPPVPGLIPNLPPDGMPGVPVNQSTNTRFGAVTPETFGTTAQPGASTGTLTPFDANNNLIGQQIGVNSPDTQAARQGISTQLGALDAMPNRQQLAEQSYNALANLDTANLQRDIQGAGQRAAQFGRLGSGMVTAETGDIFGQHQAELANIKAQLASGTAGQEAQDALNRLSAQQGVAGQLSGLDQQQYGNLTNERGYQAGLSQQAYNNALSAAGLTQPNPLGAEIAQGYSNLGQGQMAGAGNTLATLFGMSNPYQYGKGA